MGDTIPRMKFLPALLCLCACLVILGGPAAPTADAAVAPDAYMDSAKVELLHAAQEHLFSDRFELADSLYRDYCDRYHDDPAGRLFRAAGLMAAMSDAEEELHSALFNGLLDSVESLTTTILDTCDDRTAAWMYLLRGHTRAQRSLWESRFGSFFKAVRTGLSADNEYSDGLERDSTLFDIYAGLGSYHYWKSAKAGMLRWIGLFKDEKTKGIDELRLAIDSSLVHRQLARSALIWVWLDRREYDSAIVIARDMADAHPDGKTFLWPMAQAYHFQQQYDSAEAVYTRIRRRLEYQPGNFYNLIEVDYYRAQCFVWMHDDAAAKQIGVEMGEYLEQVPEATRHRQRSKVQYLQKLADR